MARGLIAGIPDHDVIMKQIKNGDQEFVVLNRFPFHEAVTPQMVFHLHAQAVRLLFQYVPKDQQIAVLGRFNRKLVKRMRYLENLSNKEE
jgi:hypothetical protein